MPSFAEFVIPGLLAGGRLLKEALLAGLLWEAVARMGWSVAILVQRQKSDPLMRLGVGLLLGWPVLGLCYLGLALTGLMFPALVVASAVALVGASRGWSPPRPLLLTALVAWSRAGRWGLAALALGVAPFLVFLAVPEFDIDCYIYHLGVPWQFLQAHRALLEHVPFMFHFPLPIEMTFALPMALGEVQLAKWVNGSFFLAVNALFASRSLQRGDGAAAWLGPLLTLPLYYICWLLPISKSDVAAAALIVAAMLLHRQRMWWLSALLFGIGVSAKLVTAPLVVAWWLFHPPPPRRWAGLAALMLLPLVPWLAKAFLATANPVYPFGSRWIPTLDWDVRNTAVWFESARHLMAGDTFKVMDLPGAWWTYMRQTHLLLAVLLPGLALLGRQRRAVWACIGGGVGILALGHVPRYLLATAWFPCLLAAEEAARLPAWSRNVARFALGLLALGQLAFHPRLHPLPWKNALAPRDQALHRGLTTYQEAIRAARAHAPGRLLSVCTPRTYPLAGRLLYAGVHGETPLVWKIVRASHSVEGIAKRMKQLGAPYMLYNFARIEWFATRYIAFHWDQRMLRLYADYCKGYLTVEQAPARYEALNGGFYLFRIHAQPLAAPPAYTFFTPGTETVFRNGIILRKLGRYQEAVVECQKVLTLLPDVGHAWTELGYSYTFGENWAEAYRTLKPFVERGMVDDVNLVSLGSAALATGRFDEAEQLYEQAYDRYPHSRELIDINRGTLWFYRARQRMKQGQYQVAERLLADARGLLRAVSCKWDQQLEGMRLKSLALVLGSSADALLRRGQRTSANKFYHEALEIDPASSQAGRWKQRLREMVPSPLVR